MTTDFLTGIDIQHYSNDPLQSNKSPRGLASHRASQSMHLKKFPPCGLAHPPFPPEGHTPHLIYWLWFWIWYGNVSFPFWAPSFKFLPPLTALEGHIRFCHEQTISFRISIKVPTLVYSPALESGQEDTCIQTLLHFSPWGPLHLGTSGATYEQLQVPIS